MIAIFLTALCSLALADGQAEKDVFIPVLVPPNLQLSSALYFHGPDGPPPDDGYEFDDGGETGNFFGRLGMLSLVGAGVSGTIYLLSSENSEHKNPAADAAMILSGAGLGFLVIERVF